MKTGFSSFSKISTLGRLSWAGVGLLLIALVGLSPAVVAWIATSRRDWNTLSDVGQVYGLASAALAALALIFVGSGIIHQARQTKIAQLQTSRAMQLELVKMALEDPTLQEGWTGSVDLPYDEWRIRSYLNLIVMYLRMTFVIGEISEKELRRTMTNRFRTQLGRDYWQQSRHAHLTAATTRREHDFFRISEEMYEEASRSPVLADPKPNKIGEAIVASSPRSVRPNSGAMKFFLAGAVAGAAALSGFKWLRDRNKR